MEHSEIPDKRKTGLYIACYKNEVCTKKKNEASVGEPRSKKAKFGGLMRTGQSEVNTFHWYFSLSTSEYS